MEEGIKQHIPHKVAKTRDGDPWITHKIRSLIRKWDRQYKRKKATKNQKDLEQFKSTKALVQKKLRQAYWK